MIFSIVVLLAGQVDPTTGHLTGLNPALVAKLSILHAPSCSGCCSGPP